ncbi:hypothetical protein HMPREF0645_1870 [Hallella bergensis DSM 17361]|uniref:DUF4738 domain-containing protein n=2 Tax=Hallella bergensis TaxID=242750 RepID=D1PY35_9BACT|nr:hypothetical protein HMPREF0645_1870 [Hallella bergensis DSM 17361]
MPFVFSTFLLNFAHITNIEMMKRLLDICVMAVAVLALSACSEKKSNTIIITKKRPEIAKTSVTRKMGDYSQERKTEWLGKQYTIETKLWADESLPLASDGFSKYYDNRIMLRVVRADGTEFLKKEFTKSFFREYINDTYYKDGALLGIVFVQAEGRYLLFAASVGNPDKSSDEYVPLVLKIDNFGNVSISKDTQLDTDSQMVDEEEDGV